MNRNRLLLIGFIALALGAFVSFAVYRTLQSRTSSKIPPGEEVFVARCVEFLAAVEIEHGSRILRGRRRDWSVRDVFRERVLAFKDARKFRRNVWSEESCARERTRAGHRALS